jgi:hypothetical protein
LWLGREGRGHHHRPMHAFAPAPAQAIAAPSGQPNAASPVPPAASAAPVQAAAQPSSNGSFVIPDSGRRMLTPADLAGLSAQQLKIARNEIFARHGRIFLGPALQAYFSAQPWYAPRRGQVVLSPLEAANVALIRETEARSGAAPGNDNQP